MKEFDSRGLSCPIPVVNTKKALKENPEGIIMAVDNIAAKENVSRYAERMGYKAEAEENGGEWRIKISK